MSHFRDFVGAGGDRAFLVIVNPHGETMVAKLDKDGKPTTWAIAAKHELAHQILAAQGLDFEIIWFSTDSARVRTRGICRYWSEVADVLSGNGSKSKLLRMKGIIPFFDFARGFIEWRGRYNPTLTERAIKADEAERQLQDSPLLGSNP